MDFQILYWIAAFITAIVGTYLADSIRRKNKADAAQSLTDSALKMVDAKDKELDDARKEKTTLRLYIGYLTTGIRLLQAQLEASKIIPSFDPEPLETYKKG